MDNHLGYAKHDPRGNNSGNSRNGRGKKSVVIDSEEVQLAPPSDRNGDFEPQLIPKRQRYFKGFNDKIIAMYARGMSVRDMQALRRSCLIEFIAYQPRQICRKLRQIIYRRSHLSWHHPDAQVALQQSPILQDDG